MRRGTAWYDAVLPRRFCVLHKQVLIERFLTRCKRENNRKKHFVLLEENNEIG